MKAKEPVITAIRSARLKVGLSVREASKACGVAASSWQNYENGTVKTPNVEKCRAIRKALGERRITLTAVTEAASQNVEA